MAFELMFCEHGMSDRECLIRACIPLQRGLERSGITDTDFWQRSVDDENEVWGPNDFGQNRSFSMREIQQINKTKIFVEIFYFFEYNHVK